MNISQVPSLLLPLPPLNPNCHNVEEQLNILQIILQIKEKLFFNWKCSLDSFKHNERQADRKTIPGNRIQFGKYNLHEFVPFL